MQGVCDGRLIGEAPPVPSEWRQAGSRALPVRLRRSPGLAVRHQQQQEQCALGLVSGGGAAGFPALHDRAPGAIAHPPFPARPTAFSCGQFEHGVILFWT